VKGPSLFGRQIIQRDHFVANIPGLEATIPEVKAHQRPETTCSSADAAAATIALITKFLFHFLARQTYTWELVI
jgi:hypothetical protein